MKLPPTVEGQRFFGSVFHWRNLRTVLRGEILSAALDWRERYGDIVRIRIGPHWVYLLSNPEDISYVLVENYRNFDKRTPGYRGLREYLGQGLLSAFQWEKWAKNRKKIQPLFQKEQIQGQVPVFLRRAERLTNRLAGDLEGRSFDLGAAMTSVTLGILGESILGCELEEDSDEINDAVARAFEHVTAKLYNPLSAPTFFPSPRNLSFLRAKMRLRKIVGRILQEGSRGDAKTLFTALAGIPGSEIFHEFLTMIQAGHETTANALNWVFVRLHENPDVLTRVEQEVRNDEIFETYKTFETSSYLHKVVLESMRLDPAAWGFDRRVRTDDTIGGFRIPAGSFVMISPYVTHRHPDYWPDPERFDPGRFDPENIQCRPKLAYLPFGAGPRVCIGQQFALLEMKIILATILRRGRIEIFGSEKIVREPSVTLRPKAPIKAYWRPVPFRESGAQRV